MTRPARRIGGCAAALLLAGCTFGGLADYTIGTCDPNVTSYAEDDCEALDTGTAGCWRHRCNATTRRCEIALLDADRDGDPAATCGGGDCDDADPRRSRLLQEACDGVDNDCDGVVDDHLPWTAEIASRFDLPSHEAGDMSIAQSGASASIASVVSTPTGACIHVSALPGDPFKADCTLLGAESVDVIQPFAVASLAGGVVGVFVRGDGCSRAGQLSFRNSFGAGADLPECLAGASRPAFAPYADGAYGVVVLSGAPLQAFGVGDTETPCGEVLPAPLSAVWLRDPYGAGAAYDATAASFAERATVTHPLGLVPTPSGSILVAAPDDGGVSIWALTAPSAGAHAAIAVVARLEGSTFAGATDVALALRPDATADNLALLVQRGCAPGDDSLVIGTFTAAATFLPRVTLDLPPSPQPIVVANDAGPGYSMSGRGLSTVAFTSGGAFAEWRVLFSEGSVEYVFRAVPVGDAPGIANQGGYAVSGPVPVSNGQPLAAAAQDGTVLSGGSQLYVQDGPLSCTPP